MARSRHFHVYNDGLRSEPFCYRAEARERARLLAGIFGTPGGFLPNIGECCKLACLSADAPQARSLLLTLPAAKTSGANSTASGHDAQAPEQRLGEEADASSIGGRLRESSRER